MLTLPRQRSRKTLVAAVVSVALPAALTLVAVAGDLAGVSRTSGAADSLRSAARAASTESRAPITAQTQATPGMRLLIAAAAAGESTSYQGVELIARWTMTGTSTVLSTVLHTRGGQTMTQTTEAAGPSGGKPQLSYDPYQELPEGVFGVTKPLVTLLPSHYVAILAGTGSVAGRTAKIVEVRRPDGALAARFWLDTQTSLPLRREDYDNDSQLINEASFIQVKFGPAQANTPLASATAATGGWTDVAVPAALVSRLRTGGWPLPVVLPGGLSLYAAAISSGEDGAVNLNYSDGLFEVSLFVQKGILAPRLAGWQVSKIAGRPVFVSARGVTWPGKGFVYTVVSDASPQVVTEAVAALPHDRTPGFWTRLGHGLRKLAHLVDPFP